MGFCGRSWPAFCIGGIRTWLGLDERNGRWWKGEKAAGPTKNPLSQNPGPPPSPIGYYLNGELLRAARSCSEGSNEQLATAQGESGAVGPG